MRRSGFTIIELLVVIAVIAILLAIAALDVRPLSNDARTGASEVMSIFRLTRSRAMGTTSAHRVVVTDQDSLRVESAVTCADPAAAWSVEPNLNADLRYGAFLVGRAPDEVLACYDSRGLATASPVIVVEDGRGRTATVEVFAGGGVELQ